MTSPAAAIDTLVWVENHAFRIAEPDNYDLLAHAEKFRTNGLVVPGHGVLWIRAGIAVGFSRITVESFHEPAVMDDAADWEDVIEVSMTLDGPVVTAVTMDGSQARQVSLELAEHSGCVRVRAHARGRDIAWDGSTLEPVEHYLFQMWPGPEAAPIVHRRSHGRATTI